MLVWLTSFATGGADWIPPHGAHWLREREAKPFEILAPPFAGISMMPRLRGIILAFSAYVGRRGRTTNSAQYEVTAPQSPSTTGSR